MRLFHVRATHRARKNHMDGLLDSGGNWVNDSSGMSKVAREYFLDLFHLKCRIDAEQVLSLIPHCALNEMNEELTRTMGEKEIREALDHMDPRKALGIDGLSGLFF